MSAKRREPGVPNSTETGCGANGVTVTNGWCSWYARDRKTGKWVYQEKANASEHVSRKRPRGKARRSA